MSKKSNFLVSCGIITVLCCQNAFGATVINDNRIDVVSSEGWGANLSHNEGKKPDGFAIRSDLADLYSGSGWYNGSGDNVIAVIAKQISKNGACLTPVNMHCHQGNDGRWGGYTEYYELRRGCVWLCADGYAGEGCGERSEGIDSSESWDMLNDSTRTSLPFDKNTNIIEDISGFDEYDWKHAGDTRHGDIVLGVVKYGTNGVFAAPVRVECIGTRANVWHGFHGKFQDFLIPEGSVEQRLLCPNGYQPNATNTDCMRVVGKGDDSSNSNVPKVTELTPSGSSKTYRGETLVALINAQKARNGYNATIHAVYNYTGNDSKPKFGIFCKDTSTGIMNADTLECGECSAGLRRGVCLKNKDGFGLCSQCPSGQIYNTDECRCDVAKSYSTMDLEFGKGKQRVSGVDTCWAKDDDTAYKNCVTGR